MCAAPQRRRKSTRLALYVAGTLAAIGIASILASHGAAPALTDEQIAARLDAGRALDRKIISSNHPHPGLPVPVTRDEFDGARQGLLSIDASSASHAEAEKLLADIDRHDAEGKDLSRKMLAKARADNVGGRTAYAKEFEHNALMAGYSVTVTVSGSKATVLNLKYPALTKAAIYQMINNPELRKSLAQRGFVKLVVQDGYDWTGSVEIQPD